MLHVYPPFYKDFHCTASACPDNCCVGWEVVVDDDAAGFYNRLPGPLGDALRQSMTIDGDGDRIIAMTGGHCPFWTEDHLCRLELELGPEAPCATCRKFPRLTQDSASSRNTASAWPAPRQPAGFSPSPGHGSWKRKASRGTPRRRNTIGSPSWSWPPPEKRSWSFCGGRT